MARDTGSNRLGCGLSDNQEIRQSANQKLISLCLCGWILLFGGCRWRGQQYHHFITPTPLPAEEYLVLGFLGGREPWDNEKRNARRLALRLRQRFAVETPRVHVETVENMKRHLAVRLVRDSLDRDRNGTLDGEERGSARVILYGQSFGGAAVVKLARQLEQMGVPVLLTVQVDSVGRGDTRIPANVACAANLYQSNGLFVRGEPEIRAVDTQKTRILGNFRYDYSRKGDIDLSRVGWLKKAFRTAHTKMDFDPEVWARVEGMIVHTIRTGTCGDPVAKSRNEEMTPYRRGREAGGTIPFRR